MRNLLTLLAIALLASLGASVRADESPYNKGVAAWRIKNYAEARKQWQLSLAEGGPDEALNNLAFLFYNGLGGDAQPGKAVELWRKGAALAVSEAQLHLGEAYEAGRGVALDHVQALAWYRCAVATATRVSAGDDIEQAIQKNARKAEISLRSMLSRDQIAESNRVAQQLIAKYSTRLDTDKPSN